MSCHRLDFASCTVFAYASSLPLCRFPCVVQMQLVCLSVSVSLIVIVAC